MLNLLDQLIDYAPTNSQKKIEREETTTTVDKVYNNRKKVIKVFQVAVFWFKDGFQKNESDMLDKTLPDWVKVSKKRFDRIKNKVQNAKKNFQARPKRGSPITLNESNYFKPKNIVVLLMKKP